MAGVLTALIYTQKLILRSPKTALPPATSVLYIPLRSGPLTVVPLCCKCHLYKLLYEAFLQRSQAVCIAPSTEVKLTHLNLNCLMFRVSYVPPVFPPGAPTCSIKVPDPDVILLSTIKHRGGVV